MIYENKRSKSILGGLAVLKLSTLLYVIIEIIHLLSKNKKIVGEPVLGDLTLFYFFLMPLIFLLMYFIWTIVGSNIWSTKRSKTCQMVEDYLYVSLVAILVFISNMFQSHYEILFMFGIISASIGLGKRHGVIVSIFSSTVVLGIDLLFLKTEDANMFFQNDIILSMGFVIVAWTLGEYVKFEKNQRELLEGELSDQLQKHDYIEEMLLRNESGYNILIKGSPDPIFIHNSEKLLYMNENALKLLGVHSMSEIEGKSITDFDFLDDRISTSYIYADIVNNKRTDVTFEEKLEDKEGNMLIVKNTSAYCVYGKKPAVLTVMRDITTVRQVQELKEDVKKNIELLNESLEYNKYLTEFFSNISHELKTPLNVIFSSLQLMSLYLENYDEETLIKKKDYLVVMKQNCFRLTRLINNILDVTKLDAGFITLRSQNKDIVSSVEEITMSILPYSEDKGVEIIFDTDEEERIIAFDEDKLERIILNLLSNALKFTNRGGQIFVDITNEDDNVLISVRDTGIGIPKDKQELIFERFMQVDKTFKRNHEGTGIGLSLVKSFVELHGGRMELNSKENEGSEFIVILPARVVEVENISPEMKGTNIMDRVNMELSDIYSDKK